MQTRPLLLVLTLAAAALAGCATDAGGPSGAGDDAAAPPSAISNEQALALFSQAAGEVPERYGVAMTATKEGTELMRGEGVFDEPAGTAFFRMSFDESLAQDAAGGFGGMSGGGELAMLTTREGSAILVNGTVMLAPPDESSPWAQGAQQQEGVRALTDPEMFLGALAEENVTVTSVTPTTLRGKPAFRVEATVAEEEGPQNMSFWLFQSPARVGRIEMVSPPTEDDPMAGATIAMDMLYDDEVELTPPPHLQRALGLRYESDRPSFGGFMGGGSSDEDAPEVWTFQVSGGIALGEVLAEVGEGGTMEGDAPAAWSMALSEGTRAQDGVTLTFDDADGDGRLSANDTLTIERGEDAAMSVWLKDTVSGYRVVPGLGAVLAALGAAAVALAVRRQ